MYEIMFAISTAWPISIPPLMTLACASVLCYMCGRVVVDKMEADRIAREQRQRRAKGLAKELKRITDSLRADLNSHRDHIEQFKGHLTTASKKGSESHTLKMKSASDTSPGDSVQTR